MKTHILSGLILTLLCIVLFMAIYSGVIWGIAQVIAPNNGKGEVESAYGRIVGFTKVGQSFSLDKYFWSRPSAAGYNAAGSTGSNKGPSNPEYLAQVAARIDTFLIHNPSVQRSEVPAELVTSSGSGLDPHLSRKAAEIQVSRIAKVRGIPTQAVQQLIDQGVEGPWLGLFGPSQINVLKLNLALDKIKM